MNMFGPRSSGATTGILFGLLFNSFLLLYVGAYESSRNKEVKLCQQKLLDETGSNAKFTELFCADDCKRDNFLLMVGSLHKASDQQYKNVAAQVANDCKSGLVIATELWRTKHFPVIFIVWLIFTLFALAVSGPLWLPFIIRNTIKTWFNIRREGK